MQALQAEVKELQRAHSDDKAAQQQALMRFYWERNVNLFGSCTPTLLTLVAPSLAALLSPHRQSLPDRLAGNVWVKADPGKARWSLTRLGRRHSSVTIRGQRRGGGSSSAPDHPGMVSAVAAALTGVPDRGQLNLWSDRQPAP
jgi:hypothetical protein